MPKKILIADDEPHIRLLIEQTIEELEDEGVEILTATNGEEALSMILSEVPDLVLLDVMMPGLNGYQVCERLRQDGRAAGTHVIFLTAKGQEYDRARGQQVGADAYITKPFDPDDLLETARNVVGLSRP